MVIVLEKGGSGWWYVQAKAGTGWAPSHYLKVPTELMDANPEVFIPFEKLLVRTITANF